MPPRSMRRGGRGRLSVRVAWSMVVDVYFLDVLWRAQQRMQLLASVVSDSALCYPSLVERTTLSMVPFNTKKGKERGGKGGTSVIQSTSTKSTVSDAEHWDKMTSHSPGIDGLGFSFPPQWTSTGMGGGGGGLQARNKMLLLCQQP
jgi:uncharacterized membrane protein